MTTSDRTGQRFGKLTVVSMIKKRGFGTRWVCRCDCGKEIITAGANLDSGNTKSCGCSRKTHGLTKHRVYGIWKAMHGRCYYENANGYHNYGGRGIMVCERWHKFKNFIEDMGLPPDGLTLEREDNDKDYGPDNCHWDTYSVQLNHRRNNVNVTAFGRTQTATQWAREYGMAPRTLLNRLQRSKMTPEDALTQKMHDPLRVKRGAYNDRANNNLITAFGKTQTLTEWCREYNLRQGTLREYIERRGMAPEEAIRVAQLSRREKFARLKLLRG